MARIVATKEKCNFIAFSKPNADKHKRKNKNSYVNENYDAMTINFSKTIRQNAITFGMFCLHRD